MADEHAEFMKHYNMQPVEAPSRKVTVVTLTDDNRSAMARQALAMYIGEICKFCKREFATLEDLHDAVCADKQAGRIILAHEACWFTSLAAPDTPDVIGNYGAFMFPEEPPDEP